MKTAGKLLLWVAGVYLGLVLASGFAIKAMLSSARINGLFSSLKARVPVTVSAEEGSFDLAQWFLFRPTVTLRRLVIANPPGFSSQPLLEAGEASAQVALLSLLGNTVRILKVTLREPVVRVETDSKGNTNAAVLVAALAGGGSQGGVAIDGLSLLSGTFRYAGETQAEAFAIRDIQLSLSDFAADKTCRVKLGARLFGGRTSRLDFEGQAGPATEDSLPAQGNLSVVLAPAEIPQALRAQYLGDVLSDPGGASRAQFTTVIRGDLMKTLQGEGQLELTGFELGVSKDKRLALEGKAPLRMTIRKLMSSPSFELATQDASLQLGQGRWHGAADAAFEGPHVQGQSSGAITGVRIEQMLGAFSSIKQAVSGVAEIPEYQVRFAGNNAAQIRESLTGQGQIKLQQGRIGLFDLLNTVEGKMKNMQTGEGPAPGGTDFVSFASRFVIKNGKVVLPNVALQGASSVITGQGYVSFDHTLNFDLVAALGGARAASLGGKAGGAGQASLRFPVKVRGTVESPKVYADFGGMVRAKVGETAKGLFGSFLNQQPSAQAK